MPLQLTEAAVQRVRQLKEDPTRGGDWLRIGIRGGGCSGLAYFLDWVPAPDERDKTFEFGEGVQVCVDRKSYVFLNSIEVDFQTGAVKTGFIFNNPMAQSTCSCGESFSV